VAAKSWPLLVERKFYLRERFMYDANKRYNMCDTLVKETTKFHLCLSNPVQPATSHAQDSMPSRFSNLKQSRRSLSTD
jgi:hypothetical protein